MGASVSKRKSKDVVCVDCDKKTQKDLPSDKQLSSACDGMPCELLYKVVVRDVCFCFRIPKYCAHGKPLTLFIAGRLHG